MRQLVLREQHIALGARMVNYAGWEMPLTYSGIVNEHNTVRTSVGLFDIDHMGQIEISGSGSYDFMQYMMTLDISRVAVGEAKYSIMCYADGTIVDDMLVYRFPTRYFIVVNACNRYKVLRWLLHHAQGFDTRISDLSDELHMLSLQGPRSEEVLQRLTNTDIRTLRRFAFKEDRVAGISTLLSRTGYTGEDGFELFFSNKEALRIWDSVLEAGSSFGIKPVGLGARDTLRFEARFPLYNNEIGPEINPYEALLGRTVNLEKGTFVGRLALLKVRMEGIKRRLVGFEIIKGKIARNGATINVSGHESGFVTSGMYAPTIRKRLGLGYVRREHAITGTELEIHPSGTLATARIVETPFYRKAI